MSIFCLILNPSYTKTEKAKHWPVEFEPLTAHWHSPRQIKETLRHKSRGHDLWKVMWVAYVYISTESFLLLIPVSDWLIFCCGNLIVRKKRNENDKYYEQINFAMKNNQQNKKCLKIICIHIVGFFIYLNSRSSRPEVFCKKGAVRYFLKFNRPESFLNKVAGLSLFIRKETLVLMFSWEFYEISKSTFFIEHLWWLLLKLAPLAIDVTCYKLWRYLENIGDRGNHS